MPKLDHFEIEFDNPVAVYYAGGMLNGRLIVKLNEPMEMRGVRVRFTGLGYTHWTERHGTGNQRRTYYYDGREQYFDQEITVYGNLKGVDAPSNPVMPPGTHSFAFNFPLPINCPSSFEGMWGNVRYIVDAHIDRPWKFDHKTKRPFTVLAMRDLNADPSMSQPYAASGEKTLGFMCCVAGQVTCQLNLPKRGYVAGEVVGVSGEIHNNSSRNVEKVSMRLIQTTIFTARSHHRSGQKSNEVVLVEAIKGENIGPGESQVWTNEGVRLPPVPLTLGTSLIINIYYTVEFKISPGGLSTSLTVSMPITVGSVPLRQQMPQFQQAYRQFSIDAGVSQPDPYPAASVAGGVQPSAPLGMDAYPDLPPPAYAESTTGRVSIKDDSDNEHTRGQLEYAPRYAYYDWASAPAADQAQTLSRT